MGRPHPTGGVGEAGARSDKRSAKGMDSGEKMLLDRTCKLLEVSGIIFGMTPEDIKQELEREPFVPLRLHLSSGQTMDILYTGTAWLRQNT